MTKPITFITGIMSAIIGIDAFAAPSVRMGGTTNTPTQTITRAGTLRSGSARTGAITNQTVKQTSATQKNSSYTVAQDSNADERIAITSNKNSIKNNFYNIN